MEARSEGQGKGTCMRVSLPVAPSGEIVEEGPVTEGGPEADDDDAFEAVRGLDVLVVEDDREATEMMVLVLTDRGARCSRSSSRMRRTSS